MKLPRQLQRKLLSLSTTVQELVCNIVLAVEGLDPEPQRKAQTEYETAEKNKKATALIADKLHGVLSHGGELVDDIAISVAADAGRSTREIAEFLGVEQSYVMRRLCAVRKVVDKAHGCASFPSGDARSQGCASQPVGATVLELFAEAARR